MRRPVKCRLFIWLFLSCITSLFDRWSLCLCLYRRLYVRISLRINLGPWALRRSRATCSYHGRPRLTNFPRRLWSRRFWCRCRFVLSSALIFRLTLDRRRCDTICSHRLNLAFYHHFEYSAAPSYDLIRSVVRGSQWWCYCNASHKYTCVELLILEHVFMMCVARGGLAWDATWLRATYLSNFLSQCWRRQYYSL